MHFQRAIVHIDGDGFFAACEVARAPQLKGKPVVVGKEKGMALAMTYEAKARGVSRGMTMRDVRAVCPEAVILDADYDSYRRYARRMYAIARRYSAKVEEYSIDECFVDLTGLEALLERSYEQMAHSLKTDLYRELGITFSVGLAPTKVLAKVASKWKKPDGFTVIRPEEISPFLESLPVGKIWGIGASSARYLDKLGVRTAHELSVQHDKWAEEHLPKPLRIIRHELRGIAVSKVSSHNSRQEQSVRKTRTFRPPCMNRERIFSELSKNIEGACKKLRLSGLLAREVGIFLKTQAFTYKSAELVLPAASASPHVIVELAGIHFDRVYERGVLYRATGAVMKSLVSAQDMQKDMFGGHVREEDLLRVCHSVDELSRIYGDNAVFLASSLDSIMRRRLKGSVSNEDAKRRRRHDEVLRLNLPFLGYL